MGGCSIAHECATVRLNVRNNKNPYTAFLVNTNDIDLRKLSERSNTEKFILRGYERGAGRNIQIGEDAFNKYKDEIGKRVIDFFEDRDYLFVVCGLGGGTGTGAVIEAVRMVHSNGFAGRCGLILTLPRDQEGFQVLDNALQRLQIIAKAMRGLGSILLVDNQKLFEEYLRTHSGGSASSFLEHSNRYIAQMLHELNIVTITYNPISGYHFDGSELLKMLRTPGIFTFGKCTLEENGIDANNRGTYIPRLKRSIEDGVLSEGYDFTDSTRCAISMVASLNGARRIFTLGMVAAVEKQLVSYAPFAAERPVAVYADENARCLNIYTIFAGLGLPRRIAQMVELVSLYERPEVRSDTTLQALSGYRSQLRRDEMDLDSLLLDDKSVKQKPKREKSDPFDF
ncbi:Plasmid replication protein RepX [Paenibacillus solanacearum]|uniref:Plasmid replication protein RepX n=2 Tax=Paenibacillus solanacearum TaxID=2048548 RepID=A0A916K5Y0_9BACL|nr:Plasmid replication protein RepX [Paenibacillus solanacearum]